MPMDQVPRISRVEFEILSLLRSKEMYGLELVKESNMLKRGTVYVTLERMSDKGYVRSREAEREHRTRAGCPGVSTVSPAWAAAHWLHPRRQPPRLHHGGWFRNEPSHIDCKT
ncbi:PadR family transcriptional regulator [Mesorhizobium sp. M2A.F.Ca.ET.067.02.1.1]|nr:PadR family transcriptional regulator [Mesorhizobium sp. M2A.F.Ca.ET.067.02.1.1]